MSHGDAFWPGRSRYPRARIASTLEPLLEKHLHYFRVEVNNRVRAARYRDIHQLELIALPRLIASLNLGSLWSLLVPQTGFTEASRPSSNTKAPRKPTRDKYQSSSPSLLLEKQR